MAVITLVCLRLSTLDFFWVSLSGVASTALMRKELLFCRDSCRGCLWAWFDSCSCILGGCTLWTRCRRLSDTLAEFCQLRCTLNTLAGVLAGC